MLGRRLRIARPQEGKRSGAQPVRVCFRNTTIHNHDPLSKMNSRLHEPPEAKVALVAERANSTGRVASVDRAWQQILEGAWELLGVVEDAGVRSLVFAPAKKRLAKRVALESREATALGMAAMGAPYREIAVAIGSSTATAARVLGRALSKIGLRDMMELTRWHGFASPSEPLARTALSGGNQRRRPSRPSS